MASWYLLICMHLGGLLASQYTPLTSVEKFDLGKAKYEDILRESKMPRYSECWTGALDKLHLGCATLTDDMQHRLAFVFSSCFLKRIGRPTVDCTDEMTIEECAGAMSSEAVSVHMEFFTHTQNICFFLQSQLWQDNTELTISRLSESSDNMVSCEFMVLGWYWSRKCICCMDLEVQYVWNAFCLGDEDRI